MPSLVIDEAAAAAQEEIAAAISTINKSLNNNNNNNSINTSKTHHSSPHHQDYSSPLFRDEVIQQEMRYFDQVLHGANNGLGGISSGPGGDRNITTSSRKENNVMQQQQRQHHNLEQQKRSPYHISRYQSKKHHVRSKNKRNQENHKLIQKAKHSSRKVMKKLAGLGKRCTRKWGLVANTIHYKITMAVANMHSLLTYDIGQNSRRSTDGNATAKSNNDNKQPCTNKKSDEQSSRTSLTVSKDCFTDTSLWLKKRTQTISSKAITRAKSAILQVATAKNQSRKIPHIV